MPCRGDDAMRAPISLRHGLPLEFACINALLPDEGNSLAIIQHKRRRVFFAGDQKARNRDASRLINNMIHKRVCLRGGRGGGQRLWLHQLAKLLMPVARHARLSSGCGRGRHLRWSGSRSWLASCTTISHGNIIGAIFKYWPMLLNAPPQ